MGVGSKGSGLRVMVKGFRVQGVLQTLEPEARSL